MQKVARNQGKKSKKIEKKATLKITDRDPALKKFVFLNVSYPLH